MATICCAIGAESASGKNWPLALMNRPRYWRLSKRKVGQRRRVLVHVELSRSAAPHPRTSLSMAENRATHSAFSGRSEMLTFSAPS